MNPHRVGRASMEMRRVSTAPCDTRLLSPLYIQMAPRKARMMKIPTTRVTRSPPAARGGKMVKPTTVVTVAKRRTKPPAIRWKIAPRRAKTKAAVGRSSTIWPMAPTGFIDTNLRLSWTSVRRPGAVKGL